MPSTADLTPRFRIGVRLEKAHVRAHERQLPSGRVVQVREHEDRRPPAREEEEEPESAAAREVHRAATPETIHREMRADVTRMWQMETVSTYKSKDYAVLAVREALQNAVDAIHKALKQGEIKQGRFTVEADSTKLKISDNGIGMSSDDIDDKFLTLGGTGKGTELGAVGGFGVAKAVILGSSGTGSWELHTRDNYIASDHVGRDVTREEASREHRQGTALIIHYPTPWEWYSEGRVRRILADSDVGGVALELNGKPVQPTYPRRSGKIRNFHLAPSWPAGVECQIKAYRRPAVNGAMVVRINGLYQFSEPFYEAVGVDYVLDFKIAARPGTPEYPFTKGRDGFTGSAATTFNALRHEIEQESLSSSKEDKWEVTDFEGSRDPHRQVSAEAVDAFLDDPSLERGLQKVSLIIDGSKIGIGPAALEGQVGKARRSLVDTLSERKTSRENPIEQAWVLKRNKDTYGKRKKIPIARDLPILLAWDSILSMMAGHLNVAQGFKPGLLYDPETKGESDKGGPAGDVISVNPDFYALSQRKDARNVTARLHNLAAHELAHYVHPGGHGERWGAGREDIFDRTSWLLPQMEQVVTELLPQARPARATKRAAKVEQSGVANLKAKRATRRTAKQHMQSQYLSLWED